MSRSWLDVRQRLRALFRHPWLTLCRTALLGLGIASTVAAFSVSHALAVNPVGAPQPDRLVSFGRNAISHPNFLDLRERVRSFSALTAWSNINVGLQREAEGGVSSVRAALVSADYFGVFQPKTVRGRLLARDDFAASAGSVVVSERLWRNSGAEESLIGGSVRINGREFLVVGVVEGAFAGPTLEYLPDVWIPLSQEPALRPATAALRLLDRRSTRWLGLTGRLADGASFSAATAEAGSAVEHLKREFPRENRTWSLSVMSLVADSIPADVRTSVLSVAKILAVLGTIVLLIGSAGNCILLLMANQARRFEVTMRRSMGAGTSQLGLAVAGESWFIGLLATGAGLLMALCYIGALGGVHVSRLISLNIDLRLTFAAAALVLVFGFAIPSLVDAWALRSVLRSSPMDVLRGGGGATGGRTLMLRLLVVAQIGAAGTLGGATLVLERTARDLEAPMLHIEPDNLVVIPLEPGAAGLRGIRPTVLDEIKRRLLALPGVANVSWATLPPLSSVSLVQDLAPSGGAPAHPVSGNEVDPNYFGSVGLPFAAGGPFGPEDVRSVVLNETAARLLVSNNPVGSEVQLVSALGRTALRVAGVVRDDKYFSLDEAPRPFVYFPAGFSAPATGVLLVRTRLAGEPLIPAFRRAIASVDPLLPIGEVRSLQRDLDIHLGRARFLALNAAILAGVTVLAAAAALFGALSQFAWHRRREIGIRLAFGATAEQSTRPLLIEATWMTIAGLTCGVLGAATFTRLLGAQLYRTGPSASSAIAAGTAFIAACCGVAILIPVLRARRVEPSALLRTE